ncbi:class II glutamine amidotransferase [Desulforegula conservatrix]|uniref:class II glutamine amidotransferase n=1 Tax=Desulforegula conservatrix TaxID=153026 RepID=UPI00040159D1|nr:class II glutamine amidotransferase [Desulforegula conservatrix]
MCELLGMSFNKPIRPRFAFAGLKSNSDYHCDGWGLAYYPESSKSAVIFKEPIAACDSQLASFLLNYDQIKSNTFIGHIRRASIGNNSHSNTHPFSRVYNKREWTFAHNGSLHGLRSINEGLSYLPLGQTDSEKAFCILLTEIKAQGLRPQGKKNSYTQRQFKAIHQILQSINTIGDGAFNCIFSDSENLFCYRAKKTKNPLKNLYKYLRSRPFREVILRDSDLEIDLNIVKDDNEAGYIIATEKLTDEEWTTFQPGQMIVFRNGKIVSDVI